MTDARRPGIPDLRDPAMLLALGFGSGLLPKAPGTWGSAVGAGLYLLLAPFGTATLLVATLLACVVGVPLCGRAARRIGLHDHPAIVWDEIAGLLVTMTLTTVIVPAHWGWLIAGFAAFRLFDVLKPWPIGWLDRRIEGGLGIMLDDLLAGTFAALLLLAVFAVWQLLG